MEPVDFNEANKTLSKPADMTDEECVSLPVHHDPKQNVFVSKWKMTEEEKKHVAHHGYIYIMVFGDGHPPISPIARHDLFKVPEPNGKIIISDR